ncbi:unnamed protein product [Euphydryas editha]|uniref:Uncharacterized protein n=1 Tax=Euphydryas editha TaxID=104508 RepID=A0AAU9TKT6_EUPED|nr:unnamed protein product [Euphydryas editha]
MIAKTENTGVDIDAIIEESERSEPIAGPSSADPRQQDSPSNKASNQKRQKRQLQWKKLKRVIMSLGTVRRNRIPDCKLPADRQMIKKTRIFR